MLVGVSLLLPALAYAQVNDLGGVLILFSRLLNALVGILITLAIVVFFWGLVKYMMNAGTDEAHKAIHLMIWGVVAIFVMVSIWGIIQLLQRTFGVDSNRALTPNPVQIKW